MKKLFIIFFIVAAATIAFKTADFYTKTKVKNFAGITASRTCGVFSDFPEFSGAVPRTVSLTSLLFSNINSNDDPSRTVATTAGLGDRTSLSYKNGWRAIVATHPEYLHQTLAVYGKYFMDEYALAIENYYKQSLSPSASWRTRSRFQIDSSSEESLQRTLLTWRRDSMSSAKELSAFSMTNYWKEQRVTFSKYRLLIKKMLLLDDQTLSAYVKSVGDENNYKGMRPLHEWLYQQKIISMIPTNTDSLGNYKYDEESYRTWHCWFYPNDLIFLTHRLCRDYPKQWTPRRFLMEADKFAAEVEPLLPK